ncbi:N-(5'-phosphoribosyl)anthranilate isomerase [Imperialibacter sp. EC-SDR9]|uniref:phosphoribosylanthranilate isomerase n=2 Tax=Imperialibacter TaxID=1649461 RepID=UPI001251CEF0|nr:MULTISPECIES: phosphoribosylanthranilate isomerase [unclassified Imperialibacter]CAD5248870.1 N-(5'-phosphoribosyl)anthranilate isomerase [Imperialibacter sp. 89]CAD5263681.1 N-(5'-phosphoribosyl)anthranilate isomerase [Imperialibacter sp. 75]VVT07571.1 N-(5'-phosphoribosyl)anthranilate isomerase [Imperialibacter sp. EC-SDR9]
MANQRLHLKVCGMKFPDNIKRLKEVEPDFMGMIFFSKSPRFVGSELLFTGTSIFPPGAKKVGVFVNAPLWDIVKVVEEYKLEYVQLHGEEFPQYCVELRKKGMKVIKAFQVSNSFDFKKVEAFEGCIDYALFDTKTPNYGGSGEKFDWTLLNSYKLSIPFFLSGGISLEDIDEIEQLDLPKLFGIDVNSRFEVSPGLKDIDKLLALKKRMGKMKKETI